MTVNPDNEVEGDMEQFTAKLFAGDAIIGTNDTALVTIVDATGQSVLHNVCDHMLSCDHMLCGHMLSHGSHVVTWVTCCHMGHMLCGHMLSHAVTCCHMLSLTSLLVAAVTFDPVNYTVNEGAAVVLMLRVTMMLDIAVNVTVSTVPVTAGRKQHSVVTPPTGSDPAHSHPTDIDDFVSGTYNVTFGPGVMAANLSIMTHSDLMDEETELFQAVIVSTTLRNVVVGAANVANIAISDTTGMARVHVMSMPLALCMPHH